MWTMDDGARTRLQVRFVLVGYRAEVARLNRAGLSDEERKRRVDGVRARSMQILDGAGRKLGGGAAWHPEVLEEIAQARGEMAVRTSRETASQRTAAVT